MKKDIYFIFSLFEFNIIKYKYYLYLIIINCSINIIIFKFWNTLMSLKTKIIFHKNNS